MCVEEWMHVFIQVASGCRWQSKWYWVQIINVCLPVLSVILAILPRASSCHHQRFARRNFRKREKVAKKGTESTRTCHPLPVAGQSLFLPSKCCRRGRVGGAEAGAAGAGGETSKRMRGSDIHSQSSVQTNTEIRREDRTLASMMEPRTDCADIGKHTRRRHRRRRNDDEETTKKKRRRRNDDQETTTIHKDQEFNGHIELVLVVFPFSLFLISSRLVE